jgi:AraC-like DNA-binding protein
VDRSTYRERPAPRELRGDVACTWVGHIGLDDAPSVEAVLPDGCVDLIWDGTRVFVAGADTGPAPVSAPAGTTFVGVRLRPGRASAALGVRADVVRDARPDLADVWGAGAAARLAEALDAGPDVERAVTVLTAATARQLRRSDRRDPLVDAAVRELTTGGRVGPGTIRALADDLGVTARTLHRRCTAAVGYGPKVLDRVLRLRRALAAPTALRQRGPGAVAAATGYADQAHLTRECRRLTGRTPSDLFKTDDAAPA